MGQNTFFVKFLQDAAVSPTVTTFDLTLSEFLTSPQEILLALRHGKMEENEDHKRQMAAQLYWISRTQLDMRHLELSTDFEFADEARLTLHTERLYHHQGGLRRLFFLNFDAADIRRVQPKPRDALFMHMAYYIACRSFSTPPCDLKLVYHIMRDDSVIQSKEFLVPNPDLNEVHEEIDRKFSALVEASTAPDEHLPACTLAERYAVRGDLFRKCTDYCRVRYVCQQYSTFAKDAVVRFHRRQQMIREAVAEVGA
jgi:hypothetical protein